MSDDTQPAAATEEAATTKEEPTAAPAGASAAPPAAAEPARSIKRQIEYYFSESNFQRDKFLMAEVAKSEEGWVALSVIASFNKIRQLVPTADVAVIAAALKDSEMLDVSEDGKSVRRPHLKPRSVTLGGVEYRSREEVVSHARELIATGEKADGGALSTDAQNFVTDLLNYHERASEVTSLPIKAAWMQRQKPCSMAKRRRFFT